MTKLKLEVGKLYATANMDVIKIVTYHGTEDGRRYEGDNGILYHEDGVWKTGQTSPEDLIVEVTASSPNTLSIESIIPVGTDTAISANSAIYSFLNINLAKYPGVSKMKIVIPEDHPPVEIEINRSNIVRLIDNY